MSKKQFGGLMLNNIHVEASLNAMRIEKVDTEFILFS
jgi:hypothetical protein